MVVITRCLDILIWHLNLLLIASTDGQTFYEYITSSTYATCSHLGTSYSPVLNVYTLGVAPRTCCSHPVDLCVCDIYVDFFS